MTGGQDPANVKAGAPGGGAGPGGGSGAPGRPAGVTLCSGPCPQLQSPPKRQGCQCVRVQMRVVDKPRAGQERVRART